MGKKREIRKIELSDFNKGVLKLLSQLSEFNYSDIRYEQFKDQFNKISESGTHIFVIDNLENGELIGIGSILIENKFIHNLSSVGHIEDVVIDNKYRGNGYGKILINFLTEFAKNNNCYKVILDCSENNVGFYEKCGFSQKNVQMSLYF